MIKPIEVARFSTQTVPLLPLVPPLVVNLPPMYGGSPLPVADVAGA
jgi:hypothetical protein